MKNNDNNILDKKISLTDQANERKEKIARLYQKLEVAKKRMQKKLTQLYSSNIK